MRCRQQNASIPPPVPLPEYQEGVSNLRSAAFVCGLTLLLTGCAQPISVRFATFNASLNRDQPGKLVEDLRRGDDPQIKAVAEIIQQARPEVLLINEFDYDPSGDAPDLFRRNYLSVGQNGAQPIDYPYAVHLPVNTGVHSGHDLNNDGKVVPEPGTRDYGNDCLGFGVFPGQYGMLVLSQRPLAGEVRSLGKFLWKDMPGALLPKNADGSPWYDDAELAVLPLSSKSHWDVPLKIGKTTVHLLASHPTPPAFDGPEDRNGKRNHDEIRLWADYITGGAAATYLNGPARAVGPEPARNSFETTLQGGFDGGRVAYAPRPECFVIVGDMNADPNDGASYPGAIAQLLNHPLIDSTLIPTSPGASDAAQRQGGSNAGHRSDPKYDTADFGDTGGGPGNLRCDYVLPSRTLQPVAAGVFWPVSGDDLHRLVKDNASSDHRLVWVDVKVGQ